MKISAALIVRDEERVLPVCLSSISKVADEIVVVDTGSRDGTVAVAGRFTDRLFEFAWCDDFAAARNFALEHVTCDYVLSCDADEELAAPGTARALLDDFVARHPSGSVGMVRIESLFQTPSGIQEAFSNVERFFPVADYRYEGAIHEQLVAVHGTKCTASTGLRFRHGGYNYPASSPANKAHRNKRLLTAELEKRPGDAYYLYQLGKAHFSLGAYSEAATALGRCLEGLELSDAGARDAEGRGLAADVLTDALCTFAYACANAGQAEQARALLESHKALGHGGTRRPDFAHALGYVYLTLGDTGRSKAGYEAALALGAAHEQVRGTGSFASDYHLGLLCEADRDLLGALRHYARALKACPSYAVAVNRCIDMVTEYGIALPEAIWRVCDHETFAALYLERLREFVAGNRNSETDQMTEAAAALSPELHGRCLAEVSGKSV